ncbi:hypothetical protein RFI_36743 [Reticulomyxa filosa]|uniref:Uncharacterized protein n=1 Tax=Reticulomyxa filosa TaxID=46433 RepID=X6LHS9_RETFI|nr:hypothetical protein RFI_36743 [Reticulomyxa filosa]|eukprot:ETO00697.1 hypothetical protein RFI_36743 [Reticulomyxa filosa]
MLELLCDFNFYKKGIPLLKKPYCCITKKKFIVEIGKVMALLRSLLKQDFVMTSKKIKTVALDPLYDQKNILNSHNPTKWRLKKKY